MGWAIYYRICEGAAEILRCLGDGSPLTLPETIGGLPVTGLGPDCFGAGPGGGESALLRVERPEELPTVSREPGNLTRVTLPAGLRTVGERAFARCRELRRLTLPAGLEGLGPRCFDSAGLEHLDFPAGLRELPDYLCANCRALTRVTLPEGLEQVGNHAFYNCMALQALELPRSVTFVGGGVFMNCKALSRLVLPLGVNLSVILSDLSNDLDLTVLYPDGVARFFLPGFSYEYEDINAPRMWRTITYGSGQLYRECFSSRDVDFDLYESYFDLALKQDSVETTVKIAWYRLRWPYGLRRGREIYLDHITAHCKELMAFLLAGEDLEGLELFLSMTELTPAQREALLTQAERAGQVRFVSRLLETGRTGGADKEFDL